MTKKNKIKDKIKLPKFVEQNFWQVILIVGVVAIISVGFLFHSTFAQFRPCSGIQVRCDGVCQNPVPVGPCNANDGTGRVGTYSADGCGVCENLHCPTGQTLCSGVCQDTYAFQGQSCDYGNGYVGTYNACGGCVGATCPAPKIVCGNNCQAVNIHSGESCDAGGGYTGTINNCGACVGGTCSSPNIVCSGICKASDPKWGTFCGGNGTYDECGACIEQPTTCEDCDDRFVNVTGDTMTGDLNVDGSITNVSGWNNFADTIINGSLCLGGVCFSSWPEGAEPGPVPPGPNHFKCIDSDCVLVAGAGPHECLSSVQCITPPLENTCEGSSCKLAFVSSGTARGNIWYYFLEWYNETFGTSETYDSIDCPGKNSDRGITAADCWCQREAELAGLNGIYRAWLSDTYESAKDRLEHSNYPYYLVDGTTKVANNWSDLIDESLLKPIKMTAFGGVFAQTADVLTGTHPDGSGTASLNCLDWTSENSSYKHAAGRVLSTNAGWTRYYIDRSCSAGAYIYCFQQ